MWILDLIWADTVSDRKKQNNPLQQPMWFAREIHVKYISKPDLLTLGKVHGSLFVWIMR